MLDHRDPIYVKFEGQGQRSKFAVTGWKMFLFRPRMHVTRWRIGGLSSSLW